MAGYSRRNRGNWVHCGGPWDLIGHAEVPETKIDGKVARHLDRDDMVTTTMNTFTSLTVQCAQCHDHKIDPVTMEHYYSFSRFLQHLIELIVLMMKTQKQHPKDKKLKEEKKILSGLFRKIIKKFRTVTVPRLYQFKPNKINRS